MAEYEFFELVGLPFDPPEKAAKKVKTAIEKVKKELNSALGTTTQQIERDTINEKLSFLDSTAADILSGDAKLTPRYDEMARKHTETEVENLKAAVALLKLSGTRIVTNGTIRVQRGKTKLSKGNVEKAYRDAGITISEIDSLAAYPKFPTNADKIFTELEVLRKIKDPNPQGKDLTLAVDLYAFVAYLCGEPENSAEYKSKAASELASLLDRFSKQFSTRNDNLGKLCASIATAGKSYVFNSEDNRKAYNAFLEYKSPKLTKLFETMRRLSKTDLYDPRNAEQCIRTISEVFGSYDIALAIYNKEAGLKDEPYIPEKAIFHAKCVYCQNLSEFIDVNEAQKINKCSHCGKPLYKLCNKCHKNILASHDKCPECGFVFASTAMFAKFFAAAEQALRRSDFDEARSNLFQAQTADPSEKIRTAQLEARIITEEKKYEKPINDLRKLIADRKYQKAAEILAATIASFPELNITVYESQINVALACAKTAYANAKKLSPITKQADSCLEILHECVDFRPAIDFLRATPPEPCKSITVGLDSAACNANISWGRASEKGITYRIIRKQGKDIPTNEMDGEIVLDNTSDTSYKDKCIQPGKYYSYAAFAVRYGVYSSAIGKTVVVLADVTDVNCEQLDTAIRITWNNPKNCTGVSIKRTVEGVAANLTNNANGSFEDKGIKYGIAYSYQLCANYKGLPPSNGVDIIITPMIKIDAFSIKAEQIKGNTYKITWDIKRDGIDLRILVDEKQVRELKSDAHNCDINLLPDGFRTITVLAYSGGAWLRSFNSPQVNTYAPCVIDKHSSKMREDAIIGFQNSAYSISLYLKISEPIPNNVVGFYYVVRTKTSLNQKAPWADKQDIESSHDVYKVSLSAYKKGGEIVYTETAREESSYYVSLFTIYNFERQEIISNASMCRFDRPLTAELFWRVSKSLLGDLKLTIDISANRPFERIPELILCACPDGQHLLSVNDTKGRRLKSFPESRASTAQRTFSGTYELGAGLSTKQIKGLKLFLFEAAPVLKENFTLRRTKGFNGKV